MQFYLDRFLDIQNTIVIFLLILLKHAKIIGLVENILKTNITKLKWLIISETLFF